MKEKKQELVTEVKEQEADGYPLSQKAADICRDIVEATAVEIEGRRYVKVEGFQAIAIAHGCVASARDVEAVYDNKGVLTGYRAMGEVRRMDNGIVIATGEGFVGVDEVTWFGGQRGQKRYYPRPIYAVKAMAQTRGISRACRSAFAHVVVIINKDLSTTPAEEMQFLKDETQPPSMMAEAQQMSREQGFKPGDKFRGQHKKAGAPLTKDEMLKRQDDQCVNAMKWVDEHLPTLSLMKVADLAEWENNEEIKPRLDALRAGRDGSPGYEHLKGAWDHYDNSVKNLGLRP